MPTTIDLAEISGMPETPGTILTGDRTTGPLHLGHLAGSLRTRVALQGLHRQFLLLADAQGLTDNADNPEKTSANVLEVAFDYLAVGIDPSQTTLCVQSQLPALAELALLLANFVTVSRLERVPTIRAEIAARGFGRDVPAGFLLYPAAQAADITGFGADLVPVGEDQIPLIELCNEVVSRVNRIAGSPVLRPCRAVLSSAPRLPSASGQGKMSKSDGTALALSATPREISAFVQAMFTDPGHLKVSDPGKVEGNVVFAYLDAFDGDTAEVEQLKEHYRAGGLGDGVLKRRLDGILQEMLRPIRERRALVASDPGEVLRILREGAEKGREVTGSTLREVRRALGLFSF